MIAESVIIGFGIVLGFWILAKCMASIGEAFLKYLSHRDRLADQEKKRKP